MENFDVSQWSFFISIFIIEIEWKGNCSLFSWRFNGVGRVDDYFAAFSAIINIGEAPFCYSAAAWTFSAPRISFSLHRGLFMKTFIYKFFYKIRNIFLCFKEVKGKSLRKSAINYWGKAENSAEQIYSLKKSFYWKLWKDKFLFKL